MRKIKHLKLIICILLLVLGVLGYRVIIIPYINNYKFERALEEAKQIPDSYWDEKYKDMEIKDKYKVVFVTNNGAEFSFAEYFKFAANKLGWEVKIYGNQTMGYENEILAFDPDFMIYTPMSSPQLDTRIKAHRAKKYLFSFVSFKVYRNIWTCFSKKETYRALSPLNDFLVFADGVIAVTSEIDFYRKTLQHINKHTFNGLRVLPTLPETHYEPAEPKTLMWIGMGTDKYRSSARYMQFVSKLSNDHLIKVYGPYLSYISLSSSAYDGYLAPGMGIIDAIRRNGIYLLTHSNTHFMGGEPSMRLFEALAANVVIISDRHPFVVENFGDNVLYFDSTADADTMYAQVKAHYEWVKENPEKAKSMADKAHQIFLDKFTLEKGLKRIAKMHEGVLKQDKLMNLNYKLVY